MSLSWWGECPRSQPDCSDAKAAGGGHRLNRGGNRQLNKAIHTAALTQIAHRQTEGRRYYERCLARGKTKREAIRALKRRISDRIWTHLKDTNLT